jgi:hypothetical protein
VQSPTIEEPKLSHYNKIEFFIFPQLFHK